MITLLVPWLKKRSTGLPAARLSPSAYDHKRFPNTEDAPAAPREMTRTANLRGKAQGRQIAGYIPVPSVGAASAHRGWGSYDLKARPGIYAGGRERIARKGDFPHAPGRRASSSFLALCRAIILELPLKTDAEDERACATA
jgi:hypothetical protein